MSASTSTKLWGVVAAIERDLLRALDCQNELKNGLLRSEAEFQENNARRLFSCAGRIYRRRKRALRLLAQMKGGQ